MRTITEMKGDTHIAGIEDCKGFSYSASLSLVVIRIAWHKGCNFEDLANGFGEGEGTHGDWSAIRDSSHEAIMKMLERSLNYLDK